MVDVRFALPNPYVHVVAAGPADIRRACTAPRTKESQMNSSTSNPRDIAEEARRLTASRARRAERRVDHGPTPARPAHTVRLVIVAALVSAVSLVIVTTRPDDVARATTALAATPRADTAPHVETTTGRGGIDHGAIASDAPSAGDAETVEASIAAYER